MMTSWYWLIVLVGLLAGGADQQESDHTVPLTPEIEAGEEAPPVQRRGLRTRDLQGPPPDCPPICPGPPPGEEGD